MSDKEWIVLQFVVSRDGGIGIAYEHSPAEGGLIAALMDHINVMLWVQSNYSRPNTTTSMTVEIVTRQNI